MEHGLTEQIYERPRDYDLEHESDDVGFYERLLAVWRPGRVLELACGARVTLPLAKMAARDGFNVVGLELAEPMLDEAEQEASCRAHRHPKALEFRARGHADMAKRRALRCHPHAGIVDPPRVDA
jgi:hypothetical protein